MERREVGALRLCALVRFSSSLPLSLSMCAYVCVFISNLLALFNVCFLRCLPFFIKLCFDDFKGFSQRLRTIHSPRKHAHKRTKKKRRTSSSRVPPFQLTLPVLSLYMISVSLPSPYVHFFFSCFSFPPPTLVVTRVRLSLSLSFSLGGERLS